MKKFAAICLALVLVLSMAVISVSAEAGDPVAFGSGSGTLNIYKNIAQGNTTGGLPGAGFTAYKVMSYTGTAPNAYFSFTEPYASDSSVTSYANTNLTLVNGQSNQYVTYGDTDSLEGMITTLEGITNNTATKSTEAFTNSDGKATFTNLDKGVYLVKETTVPDGYAASSQSFLVAILDDTAVNAYPKNLKMEIDKNILTSEQYTAALTAPTANTGSDATNLSIGDAVYYQIQSQVPNYDNRVIDQMASTSGVKVVEITDTLSNGLTFSAQNLTDMKVFAGDTDITSSVTKTRTDDQHFKVEVPLDAVYSVANNINYLGRNLYVIYEASVNSNAVVTDGNNNTAQLQYKNSPADGAYDPDPVDIPEEKIPVVYTYQMEVKKLLDGEPVGETNVSALRFVLKQGDNGVTATGSDGIYTVTSDHTAANAATEMSLSSAGTLTVKGLSAGTYTLTESGSVSGYTTLQSPLTIVVTDAGAGVVGAQINGTGSDLMVQIDNPAYDADKQAAITAFMEGKDGNFENYDASTPGYPTGAAGYVDGTPEKLSTGRFAFEINNPSSQFDLPTTGGYGILIFTLSGAVVLAAAIIIFTIARKKKENK